MVTLIPSAPLAIYAWRFWRAGSTKSLQAAKQYGVMNTVKGARATDKDPRDASARSLFFVSLVHLPLLLAVMMVGNVLESWLASWRSDSDGTETKSKAASE
jgi:heme O synthase-like polyprenyltransferase